MLELKKFTWIHDWIFERQQKDPSWKLPDNTILYIKGLEQDLEELSKQLGVDLCIMTIQHKETKN